MFNSEFSQTSYNIQLQAIAVTQMKLKLLYYATNYNTCIVVML